MKRYIVLMMTLISLKCLASPLVLRCDFTEFNRIKDELKVVLGETLVIPDDGKDLFLRNKNNKKGVAYTLLVRKPIGIDNVVLHMVLEYRIEKTGEKQYISTRANLNPYSDHFGLYIQNANYKESPLLAYHPMKDKNWGPILDMRPSFYCYINF